MTTRWERLAGDTSVFALKVSFSPDPDNCVGSDPVEATSWGGFQLWVEGRNLCAHQDGGEHFDYVHWYLLPLFEWFVENWDPLLHEEKLPVKNAADTAWYSLRQTQFPPLMIEDDEKQAESWERNWQSWYFRHSIYTARQGGLFPDVIFRRWRDKVEISWGSASGQDVQGNPRFLVGNVGVVRIPPVLVAEALEEVLTGAAKYLTDQSPESMRLQALHKAVSTLRKPPAQRMNNRLAWLAGLGNEATNFTKGWDRVKRMFKDLPEEKKSNLFGADTGGLVVEGACHAALMYGTVAPNIDESQVLKIAEAMIELHEPGAESEKLATLVKDEPINEVDSSWEQGYELAQEVLESLHYMRPAGERTDIDSILDELGVDIKELELSDRDIRGLAIAGQDFRPGIRVNISHKANEYYSGRRFTLAHEFCHLLFDRGVGRRLAVASGPWAPRDIERRANAFAAMLLMPRDLIKKALSSRTSNLETLDDIVQVAKQLGSGLEATLRHLNNLGFIDDSTRKRINYEAEQALIETE